MGSEKPHELVTTGTPQHPAFPARWFDGLFRALPGDQALLSPSPADDSTDLTSALGRQNHTASPTQGQSHVLRRHSRPSHPASNTRDDREAPLLQRRDGANVLLIWVFRQRRAHAAIGTTGNLRMTRMRSFRFVGQISLRPFSSRRALRRINIPNTKLILPTGPRKATWATLQDSQ